MKLNLKTRKSLKFIMISILFMFIFTACAHKNFDGSNDFQALVAKMVNISYSKIKSELAKDDVTLVSDFVNIDKLQNKSKLGFLLSETLKNELSSKNIIIKQVELSQNFKIGQHGFNVLSRNASDLNSVIEEERYAMVGTYSITHKRLILFVKLVDIRTGHILSSSTQSVVIDKEIKKLEYVEKQRTIYRPLTL